MCTTSMNLKSAQKKYKLTDEEYKNKYAEIMHLFFRKFFNFKKYKKS